jgi:organic radical activating enzyme
MCSVAGVQIALTVASTVAAGYAQKKQGEHEDDIAKYNARVTENEAEKVRSKGVEEENIQRQKTAQLLAKQRAQIGASGVSLTSGTPLDIQEDTVLLGEVDALRVRSNFEQEAESLESQANLTRLSGKSAKKIGQRAFTSSLVVAGVGTAGGIGVANKWFN